MSRSPSRSPSYGGDYDATYDASTFGTMPNDPSSTSSLGVQGHLQYNNLGSAAMPTTTIGGMPTVRIGGMMVAPPLVQQSFPQQQGGALIPDLESPSSTKIAGRFVSEDDASTKKRKRGEESGENNGDETVDDDNRHSWRRLVKLLNLPTPRGDWLCGGCHAPNEAGYNSCGNCGTVFSFEPHPNHTVPASLLLDTDFEQRVMIKRVCGLDTHAALLEWLKSTALTQWLPEVMKERDEFTAAGAGGASLSDDALASTLGFSLANVSATRGGAKAEERWKASGSVWTIRFSSPAQAASFLQYFRPPFPRVYPPGGTRPVRVTLDCSDLGHYNLTNDIISKHEASSAMEAPPIDWPAFEPEYNTPAELKAIVNELYSRYDSLTPPEQAFYDKHITEVMTMTTMDAPPEAPAGGSSSTGHDVKKAAVDDDIEDLLAGEEDEPFAVGASAEIAAPAAASTPAASIPTLPVAPPKQEVDTTKLSASEKLRLKLEQKKAQMLEKAKQQQDVSPSTAAQSSTAAALPPQPPSQSEPPVTSPTASGSGVMSLKERLAMKKAQMAAAKGGGENEKPADQATKDKPQQQPAKTTQSAALAALMMKSPTDSTAAAGNNAAHGSGGFSNGASHPGGSRSVGRSPVVMEPLEPLKVACGCLPMPPGFSFATSFTSITLPRALAATTVIPLAPQ